MGAVQKPKASMAGIVVVLAVLAVVLVVEHYWAYLTGPGTHDLTPQQRTGALRSALKAGAVAALREKTGMASLSREDIAHVGNSRCTGELECYQTARSRRGLDRCGKVQANLYCAYEIVDKAGNTAAALVKTFRSDSHILPELSDDDPDWRFEMLATKRPDAETAKAKLCEMGYCEPGVLTRWKPPPRVEPADPHAEARRRCDGVLADVVGKGMTCLNPADPGIREFRDCKDGFCGPAMVALPKGRYVRGTSEAEIAALKRDFPAFTQLGKEEHPEREVTIGRHVAVGKLEVTFDEWGACVTQSGCSQKNAPGDEGWGRGGRPVVNVSWNDITREYLPWLNGKLGLSGAGAYRLLTDAEWEYAARAGTTTRYAFGDAISKSDAQLFEGPLGAPSGKTAEAGSFRPNAFGLHDMHGNVAEWVEDCFSFMHDPGDLPTDGSALMKDKWRSSETCPDHAFRGGSFASVPAMVRSAVRGTNAAGSRHKTVGFRVARTLGS